MIKQVIVISNLEISILKEVVVSTPSEKYESNYIISTILGVKIKKYLKAPASQPNEATNQVFLFSAPFLVVTLGSFGLVLKIFIFQMFHACKLLGKIKPPQPICVGLGNSKNIFLRKTWKYSRDFLLGFLEFFVNSQDLLEYSNDVSASFSWKKYSRQNPLSAPRLVLDTHLGIDQKLQTYHLGSMKHICNDKNNCYFPLNPGPLTRILIPVVPHKAVGEVSRIGNV